jgi:ferredoxin-fold anticodon binding domain-containing protein
MSTTGLEFRQSLKVGDIVYRIEKGSYGINKGILSAKKMTVKNISKTNVHFGFGKDNENEEIFSIKTGKNKDNANDILNCSETEQDYLLAAKEIRRKNNIRKIRNFDLSDISAEKAMQILAILEI